MATESCLPVVFGFRGITDPTVIGADGSGTGPERRTAAVNAALERMASFKA